MKLSIIKEKKGKNSMKEENFSEETFPKILIPVRWHGYEDDGSSGCYNYNFRMNDNSDTEE